MTIDSETKESSATMEDILNIIPKVGLTLIFSVDDEDKFNQSGLLEAFDVKTTAVWHYDSDNNEEELDAAMLKLRRDAILTDKSVCCVMFVGPYTHIVNQAATSFERMADLSIMYRSGAFTVRKTARKKGPIPTLKDVCPKPTSLLNESTRLDKSGTFDHYSDKDLFDLYQQVSDELLKRFGSSTTLIEEPTQSDQLVSHFTYSLPPTLPRENPFSYDSFSSGLTVVNGWSIFYQTPNKGSQWRGLYLHNAETGQRIGIRLIPQEKIK